MKKLARKSALALAAVVATAGVLSIPTSAEADTGWGWRVIPGKTAPKDAGGTAGTVTRG